MGEREELSWIVHPIRHRHGKTAILALVSGLTFLAVWIATGSLFWLGFSILVIAVGVRQFLFPTHYRMDGDGVESRLLFYTRRVPWTKFKSFYPDRNGVLLSPFAFPTRLENFRGTYVMFGDGDNKGVVMDFVSGKIGRPEDDSGIAEQ